MDKKAIDWFEDGAYRPYERAVRASMNYEGFPMQPIVKDSHGVVRFKRNRIVDDLLSKASAGERWDLNAIVPAACTGKYEPWELQQFYQLIGYSLSGCPRKPSWLEFAECELAEEAATEGEG